MPQSSADATPDEAVRKFQKELNAGGLSLVLLATVSRSGRAMYGYEITRELETAAAGRLPMHQGAIYPALRSLERQGLLTSRVEPAVDHPPRRYYRLTPPGQAALATWETLWREMKQFIDVVLENGHAHSTASSGSRGLPGGPRNRTEEGSGDRSGRRTRRRA